MAWIQVQGNNFTGYETKSLDGDHFVLETEDINTSEYDIPAGLCDILIVYRDTVIKEEQGISVLNTKNQTPFLEFFGGTPPPGTLFSETKDTANKVNIYIENGKVNVQNKTAFKVACRLQFLISQMNSEDLHDLV